MSEYVAKLRNYRVSPRKARLVANLVRGKYVGDAVDQLRILNKKSAPVILKLIESAIANAEAKATIDVDRLKIAEIMVGEGPTWKRYLPRAQGRATPIRKRTSHITVGLSES